MVWDPFDEMRRLQKNIDKMFNEMFSRKSIGLPEFREPVVDIINKPKEVVVIAELPGIKKKDIKLDCRPYQIDIEAKGKEEEEKRKKGYYYRERASTSFKRILSLPEEVEPNKAKANFKNGVLEITLPKKKVKKKKHLSIKIE